jgi:phytoene/squalene synthetase
VSGQAAGGAGGAWTQPGRLGLYDRAAERAAGTVVREYSTSFGLATRLLRRRTRTHVANVYALVRLADEVVDGAVAETGADAAHARAVLDELERETARATASGWSSNVVVHAFAGTARRAGIGADLVAPFFASMRADTERSVHDAASLAAYVYGSAEVVGLMCLRVFLLEEPKAGRERRYAALAPGARALGAAFQKVNFLRDLADDAARLGRRYLVGIDPATLTDAQKDAVLDDVQADLRLARAAARELTPGPRRAVLLATALFAELAARLRTTPARDVVRTRVSVPPLVKARLLARAVTA